MITFLICGYKFSIKERTHILPWHRTYEIGLLLLIHRDSQMQHACGHTHTHKLQDSNICLCISQEKYFMLASPCSFQTTILHCFSLTFLSIVWMFYSLYLKYLSYHFKLLFQPSKYIYFLMHSSYNLSSEEPSQLPSTVTELTHCTPRPFLLEKGEEGVHCSILPLITLFCYYLFLYLSLQLEC